MTLAKAQALRPAKTNVGAKPSSTLSFSQHVFAFAIANALRRKPEMPTPELIALARTAAANHALDFTFSVSSVTYTGAALVCAIVEQESAWDPHAIRYEPGFRTRYVAPLGLPPTEEIARSISWGLMQVMGQVAREHGFSGKFLSALCDPALGLDIGCAALAAKLTIRPESSQLHPPETPGQGIALSEIAHALQLWNGGANPNYAAQVLARLPHHK